MTSAELVRDVTATMTVITDIFDDAYRRLVWQLPRNTPRREEILKALGQAKQLAFTEAAELTTRE